MASPPRHKIWRMARVPGGVVCGFCADDLFIFLRVFKQGDGGFEKVSLLGRTFLNWATDF